MFWIFNKLNSQPNYLFEDLVDIHNHILPGIDDGCNSISESLKMVKIYKELGFKKVIPTPHIFHDRYPNNPKSISVSYKKLIQSQVNIKSYISNPAAEYMLDENFLINLKSRSTLLLISGQYILIEIPFFGTLDAVTACTLQFEKLKITPILAHPERYYNINNIDSFIKLKDRGILFQLNLLSLLGYYGVRIKDKAKAIFNSNLYDCVSSDAHSSRDLEKLKKLNFSKKNLLNWNRLKENHLSLFSSLNV